MTPNVQALRQQLQDLRARHAAGSITPEQFAADKARIERALLDALEHDGPPAASSGAAAAGRGRRAGVQTWSLLGVFIVAVAAVGYALTGSPDKISTVPGEGTAAAGAGHEMDAKQMAELVQRLAERMQANPGDIEGWLMLGRSYAAMGRADDALAAFDKAIKLRPDDANALADYADVLAVKNGGTLEGEPMRLIEQALKADATHVKALVLSGTGAFNRGDFAGAVAMWDRAVQAGPQDHPLVQMAAAGATEARTRGKLPLPSADATSDASTRTAPVGPQAALPATAGAAPSPHAAASAVDASKSVSGTVTLKPEWQGRVSPEDSVYVYARAAGGSRMPLALLQKKVKDLPIRFTLDDSTAMSPSTKLSSVAQVIVGARITKTGQATAQPGDLEGASQPVALGAVAVAVQISTEVK
jgi:cytochrome c-type biogenesis protein CcmH